MALRLGKKKDADAVVVNEADGTTTVVTNDANALPSEDQFADLIPDNLPAKKRGPSPAVLGGVAFALVAAAVGAWLMFGNQTQDEPEVAIIPRPPARVATNAAPDDDAPAPATKPAVGTKATAKPATKATPAVKAPPAKRNMTRPQKSGIVPPRVVPGKPVIAPPKPGGVPRFVPVHGVPTPVPLVPAGMAGKDGRRADRRQVLVVTPNMAARGGSLQAHLDALWKAGADAKHRGDIEGARNQWQHILELSPNHPGIQEAINQLSS